jgi:hypothetical protein
MKKNEEFLKQGRIYQVLGSSGMLIYKLIFDANNKETVREFFRDPFILTLWPIFCKLLKEN